MLYSGLLARQRLNKLDSALAALCHCHPKNKLFSPDTAAFPSFRIQKTPISSGINRVFLISAKKILTFAEIYYSKFYISLAYSLYL